MNFVSYLGLKFFKQEKFNAIMLFLVSLASSVLQTNGITYVTSSIINFAQLKDKTQTYRFFYFFIATVCLFIGIYYLWFYFQNELLTKIRPWVRSQIVELLFLTNNQKFSEVNFSKLNSPINRITDMYYFISNTIISYLLPNVVYLTISSLYFTYLNPYYGLIFFVGNLILILYWWYNVNDIITANDKYEKKIVETDIHLIDLLNNVDKVIYRGQTKDEMNAFFEMSSTNFKFAHDYYSLTNKHLVIMVTIIFSVVLLSLYFLIHLYFEKQVSLTMFISSFTILLLYREKVTSVVELLPNLIDFIGRCDNVMFHFQHVNDNYLSTITMANYEKTDLDFKEVRFENVTYKYSGENKRNVFENRNYYLKTTDQAIIGITGPSGNGKSTFVKLLLRLYECNDGKITIDGHDVQTLDPNYIRKEITYVNQTSKLFDRKVVDNMLYGCSKRDVCDYFLQRILQYPNIMKLYRNTDIHTQQAGLLGENLSGGQRQIVNMIGGLINPSKILVLDEPTNALDPELKKEVISLIKEFSRFKQAIIIITHDKDVFPIFTQQIRM